jgi:iron(III) transport system permease protein
MYGHIANTDAIGQATRCEAVHNKGSRATRPTIVGRLKPRYRRFEALTGARRANYGEPSTKRLLGRHRGPLARRGQRVTREETAVSTALGEERSSGIAPPPAATPRAGFWDSATVSWVAERCGAAVLIVATAVIAAVPVYFVFEQALDSEASGVRQLVADPDFRDVCRQTAELTLGSGALAMVMGTVLAWWAHRLPQGRRWLGTIPFLPLVIPQIALVTGYVFMMNPSVGFLNTLLRWALGMSSRRGPIDVYTMPWVIVVASLSMAAFVFLFVRSALTQLNQEITDAAAASGAGPARIFFTIFLPVIRPALLYSALTVTLLGLGQFTVPLLLGSNSGVEVLSTKMFSAASNYPANNALAAAYGLPILVVGLLFLLVQKVLLRDQSRFVTAGGRSSRALTNSRLTAQLGLALYGIVAVALPLIALVIVSLQPFWSQHVDVGAFTFANFRAVLTRDDLLSSIVNSLSYGGGTVLIALPIAHLCARAIYRRNRKPFFADLQDLIVSLPLGIPSVIFGVGFLVLYTQSPLRLYGQGFGLVLVYVTIVLPFATRLQLSAMANLGSDLHAAAGACGAGLLRRVLTIDLPLLRPALGAASALVVVIASQEFSASILVRSASSQVMGTALYDLFDFGSYPSAAAMAIVMCLVTLLGVALAFLLGGSGAFKDNRGGGFIG